MNKVNCQNIILLERIELYFDSIILGENITKSFILIVAKRCPVGDTNTLRSYFYYDPLLAEKMRILRYISHIVAWPKISRYYS